MKSKFLIICLSFWIMLTGLSFASETISQPISGLAKQEKAETKSEQKFTGAASPIKEAKEKPSKLNQLNPKENAKKIGFNDLLFRMFKALLGVIVLIITIAFMIFTYKKLKRAPIPEQQTFQEEEPSYFPSTISEAVSSFVKHRLDKHRQ